MTDAGNGGNLFIFQECLENTGNICYYVLVVSDRCSETKGNRSLMDRTPDSDSGNAGSIPAGCIITGTAAVYILFSRLPP